MDEFHFYGDPDRGWAWQVPLLELPQAQFLLMSATLGDVAFFARRPDAPHRAPDGAGHVGRPAPGAAAPLLRDHAGARDDRRPARDPAGPGLRRALHPGRGARARAGTDERQRLHPRGEGRASPRRSATSGSPPASARTLSRLVRHGIGVHHAGHAAEVPPAGRAAGAGRPAQGHLRHRHPRRRHQRADPHRAAHRRSASTTASRSGTCRPASSTRSPAAPAAPATTRPARSWCRRPSTRSRTPGAGQGRRRPEEAPQGAAQEAAGGLRVVDRATLRPAGRRADPSRCARTSGSRTRCCST